MFNQGPNSCFYCYLVFKDQKFCLSVKTTLYSLALLSVKTFFRFLLLFLKNRFWMTGKYLSGKKPDIGIDIGLFIKNFRQRPTLPPGFPSSTIGAEELNFRVRDGNGCVLFAIATEKNDFFCNNKLDICT